MQITPDLVTTRDVATMLGVSTTRVRQLAHRPDFPAPHTMTQTTRGIGIRRWQRDDVERWRDTADRSPGRRRRC